LDLVDFSFDDRVANRLLGRIAFWLLNSDRWFLRTGFDLQPIDFPAQLVNVREVWPISDFHLLHLCLEFLQLCLIGRHGAGRAPIDVNRWSGYFGHRLKVDYVLLRAADLILAVP